MTMTRAFFLHRPDINHQRDHHDNQQSERQGGTQRPVTPLTKWQLNKIADHQVFSTAKDTRRDIGAQRRNKDKN